MKKPIILAFNRYYLPGYRAGGPIRTLANMAARLGGDFEFRIVALNHDLGDTAAYSGIGHGRWTKHGRAQVMHLDPALVSQRLIVDIIQQIAPDILYLNSFFDPVFTQRVLWAYRLGRIGEIPIILAPRGEFSEGALGFKQRKKRLYVRATALTGLYHGLVWQASSEHERADILLNLHVVRPVDIHVAMNLASVDDQVAVDRPLRQTGEPLRLCFLSRISPKKNLDFALSVLAAVKSQVVFTIYGPAEAPAYWVECERLIATLPQNVKICYAGEVQPEAVRSFLAQHDLFFFPTRGENYGHVILEALAAGLPVLISDQTPWNDVTERGVGWTLSLASAAEFTRKIDEIAAWDNARITSVSKLAAEYAMEHAVKSEVIEANRALFRSVIGDAES